ncbi:hypothetical protein HK414_00545 [Ramlibacter terrae]|uniref:Alpha/beta hydrolase n=1 Tax=Ramlibacter terrae TaxID=2732511 RepID=A0ABX6NZQ5_9BURK|nr:hypothetical protein HK414_00545 [Ramlibacter terrae]
MTRTTADTAGYYQASKGIRLFRLALTSAQRIWPSLAVRAADRLFVTPLPPKWLQRRTAWEPGWHVDHWPFEQHDLTVYTQPVAPHGPVALLVHGWGGHAGQLRALADSLPSKGCARCWSRCRRTAAAAAAPATCRSSRAPSNTSWAGCSSKAMRCSCWPRIRWARARRPSPWRAACRSSGWCCWRRRLRRASTPATSRTCSA